MRRRDFIAGLGGAVAWPIGLRAQDTAVVVGVISAAADANGSSRFSRFLREGLKRDVIVEYRGEANGPARQEELANDLVRHHVTVILAQAAGPALAAKSATSTIPIVFFGIGADPVELGLVTSINRPDANVTGVGFNNTSAKSLDLLCQLVPAATTIAYLSGGPSFLAFKVERPELIAAAVALGRRLVDVEILRLDTLRKSFESISESGAGAVIVSGIPPFFRPDVLDEIISLAARHKIPAMYAGPAFPVRGGLISYSQDPVDSFRIAVGLVGEILKGAKPADLPVRNSSKFDLVINLKTAKRLGLEVPQGLLLFANELIDSYE
jgi:putative tryptophan/tyrosine transport system substrate-binding protein